MRKLSVKISTTNLERVKNDKGVLENQCPLDDGHESDCPRQTEEGEEKQRPLYCSTVTKKKRVLFQ